MRMSTNSCLCPFLVCLCFIQRCYGAASHLPAKVPSKNQTRLASGETEVHHRPKRGWIWNQFFVLEEHMGPDAQYVGKVRVFTSPHNTNLFCFPCWGNCARSVLGVIIILASVLVYLGNGLQQEHPVQLERCVGVALAHIVL